MGIHFKKHPIHSETIIVREFKGDISSQDILNSWKSVLETDIITDSTIGIINVILNAKLTMDLDGFDLIMNHLKANRKLGNLKLAVLTNSPENIVFPMLGEYNENTLKIKPFSTEEAAISWILA